MNTDYIEEQSIKAGALPSWLQSFITSWLAPLSLLGIAVIIILMANDVELGEGAFIIFLSLIGILILDILFIRFGIGYKHRYTIGRVKENGEYDMETPRKYTALQYNWYQKFYTKFKKRRVLELFAFDEGIVHIATSDGVVLEKPLNDITFTYTTEKRSNGEKVFTFVVKDIDGGQELRFLKIPYLLEDAEWEDILNILSHSKFKRPKEEGTGKKTISAVLSMIQGDIADGIEGLADAANNSFSMIEGMKLYNKFIMKKKTCLITLLTLFMGLVLISCSTKEDEFIGSWSTSSGLANEYTQYRVYSNSEYRPTFIQTFTFEKGENGSENSFTDKISPLVIGGQNPDDVLIGSEISGTWEAKNDKLYLYYDKESFSLTNADDMGRTDKMILEEEMAQKFLDDYKNLGAEGLSYEIVHKNNKTGLEIKFGKTKVTLIKEENGE